MTAICPSFTSKISLNPKTLPIVPAVLESLPPLTKFSSDSNPNELLTFGIKFLIFSSISKILSPLSLNSHAFNTKTPNPDVTFLESITTISSLSNIFFAIHADWYVPLISDDNVNVTILYPSSKYFLNVSSNLLGVTWAVVGRIFSFSILSNISCVFISTPSR